MPKSFFFSINLLIKSDVHLEKAISSVIADEDFFLENIQLILIDSICTEQSLTLCSEYNKKYPDNIYFVDAAGKSDASAYNDARPLCQGTYFAFWDNYGEYSKKALNSIMNKVLKSEKIPILCIQPIVSPPGEEPYQYIDTVEKGFVMLKDDPEKFVLMLGCWFFHKRVIERLLFDESVVFQSDAKFITECLLQTYSYIFAPEHCYTASTATDHELFKYPLQYSKAFYSQSVDDLMIPMLINYPGSVLVQSVVMYLIESRFALNADEKYKHILTGGSVDEFFNKVSELLKYIDDSVILNRKICAMCGLDEEMTFRLLRLKYKSPDLEPDIDLVLPKDTLEKNYYNSSTRMEKYVLSGEFIAHYKQYLIGSSKDICAEIAAVNYDEEGLYFDAVLYNCSFLPEKDYRLSVIVNDKKYPVLSSGVYTLKKYFDVPFLRRYSFRFFVPVSSGKNMDTIYLKMQYRNLSFRIRMTFNGTFSRLSSKIKNSYWNFRDRIMVYERKTKSLVIRRCTGAYLRLCENKFISEAGEYVSLAEAFHYRQIRRAVRSAMQHKDDKKILMFYDEAGTHSNGNILFRYFYKNKSNDKISVFYAAKRGSDDYEQLLDEEYSGILEAGSKKAKITALCSDVVFATDCDVYESLLFSNNDIMFLKDLINAKTVSIKDFFITYPTAQFDNRLRDNTQFFFCASEREKENILKPVYDYDESMINVSGYPVLDEYEDKKEKLILIAPGDRRQFCIYANSDKYRFSESRFFHLYNDLLTDTNLHEALKDSEYKIAVMMPFSVDKFIKLFHSDNIVQLYPCDESIESELVQKASVLITDHSDLQFKFAYLNKPVIYYYPNSLPIPQEFKNEGLNKYGLGKIFFEQNNLVGYLTDQMQKGFEQPEVYSRMCMSFFPYHDRNNCERIFSAVKDIFLSEQYGNDEEQ